MCVEVKQGGGTCMLELDGRTLTFEKFRECCLEPNVPAVIRCAVPECETGSKEGFVSCLERMTSRLAPMSLIDAYGEGHHVPTVEFMTGTTSDSDQFECMECRMRPLGEVMECWRRKDGVLYLKDWHMQLECESQGRATERTSVEKKAVIDGYHCIVHGDGLYQVPEYLGHDWMDDFCRCLGGGDANYCHFGDTESDYRFAYIGPPSSWTPLHFDVFGTYSWSLNVCGEKLWFFPSPEGNQRLLETSLYGLMLPVDIRTTTGAELCAVLQRPGDLVFVPSGYLHQVHNVSGPRFLLPPKNILRPDDLANPKKAKVLDNDDTGSVSLVISINHNWCNEWCVERMVKAFCRDANRLQRLLTEEDRVLLFGEDCTAWHKHVENLLIGGTNWNFACIRSFLKHRLACLSIQNDGKGAEVGLRRLLKKCLAEVDAVELRITHTCGS
ncbi:hypothetical protein BCY84_14758 [Trypanosoma cruzi cruzi]|uniref:JmjC domain-containing protein n=1 Tax=Trypanosoma cruzi TaxID=5693 RepID=A0A2V2VII2_TRYCR|nr:hypothetical protein BCY84_14758 [Trypanosoma cruzi cruzi]PWU96190.1 hypothetical protein C4B63_19g20 [Trypanosoma cruzi]